MKLACASGAFHRAIECGDLTQLEFLDLCARDFACDGVVLDVRHFPRTDDDYLAQIKKMTTDRGLCVAALADPAFFSAASGDAGEVLRMAALLGAPLVAAPLAAQTERSWSEQLDALSAATALAKAANVTLALRNAPQTFAAGARDCKRVTKEADSAWLRLGPQPELLGADSDPRELAANAVLLWSSAAPLSERSIACTLEAFPVFRGHLALDEREGASSVETMREAMRAWRVALSQRELNSTAR